MAPEPLPRTARAGFWSSLGALLSGTLIALVPLGILAFGLHRLHVLPLGPPTDGGVGWPWRITGPWSALADIAPRLVLSLALAYSIEWCLGNARGPHLAARWPLALCTFVFSWPVGGRSDLLGVSGGVGFIAMWFVTNRVSGMPRRTVRIDRRMLAAAGVTVTALAAVSVIYGAMNPVAVQFENGSVSVVNGASYPVPVDLYDRGPLGMRVLSVSTTGLASGVFGYHFGPLERATRTEASSIDGLYAAGGPILVAPGRSVQAWVMLHGPRDCSGYSQLSAITVRYVVDGTTKTTDIQLPSPTTIQCRTT